MKILVVADVHGDSGRLERVLEGIDSRGIDLVVCPGDFTDMFSDAEDFSQMDIAEFVLQKLLALGKPLLCVPGNHDPYEILEMFDEYGVNLHNRVVKFRGIDIAGWGGAPTPFNTIFEPSDGETREALDRLGSRVEAGKFLLVVHDPPKGTRLDLARGGKHVGSPAIRGFIERKRPVLAISAHIHEAGGLDRVGSTQVFYPGPAFEGWYGIVTLEDKRLDCERKRAGV
jgi:Icc-related predicted phosphoesterase